MDTSFHASAIRPLETPRGTFPKAGISSSYSDYRVVRISGYYLPESPHLSPPESVWHESTTQVLPKELHQWMDDPFVPQSTCVVVWRPVEGADGYVLTDYRVVDAGHSYTDYDHVIEGDIEITGEFQITSFYDYHWTEKFMWYDDYLIPSVRRMKDSLIRFNTYSAECGSYSISSVDRKGGWISPPRVFSSSVSTGVQSKSWGSIKAAVP